MTSFYFGCHERPGHYWWMRSGAALVQAHGNAPERIRDVIDGTFAPPIAGEQEGVAQLVHLTDAHRGAVTVLAFWDRSVDTRGQCNSAFVFTRSRMSFDDALAAAREAFPMVFARFKFQITEYHRPVSEVVLLRSPIALTVREVGSFPGHASPLAILETGEAQFRLALTMDEARALGSRMNQTVQARIGFEDEPKERR